MAQLLGPAVREEDGVPAVAAFTGGDRITPALRGALAARGLRPTWAEDSITADVATAEEAAHLEIAPGAVVMRVARRALAGDKCVEVSRSVFRADRFTCYVQFSDQP